MNERTFDLHVAAEPSVSRQNPEPVRKVDPQKEPSDGSRPNLIVDLNKGDHIARLAFLEFMDDASPKGHGFFYGVTWALSNLNLLGEDGAELWERRAEDVRSGKCPLTVLGDSHPGSGRNWCAVCGSLPAQEGE